ncbi:hypothetical protein ASD99_07540 [Mesorhizobium sp. Root695]|nr:hypothetical protein ASD99_07540 [Mesorhizobium sp. Root695]
MGMHDVGLEDVQGLVERATERDRHREIAASEALESRNSQYVDFIFWCAVKLGRDDQNPMAGRPQIFGKPSDTIGYAANITG